MATDHLDLKHQAISTRSTDEIIIVLEEFQNKILHALWKTWENNHCIGRVSKQNITFIVENTRKLNHIQKKYTQFSKG